MNNIEDNLISKRNDKLCVFGLLHLKNRNILRLNRRNKYML